MEQTSHAQPLINSKSTPDHVPSSPIIDIVFIWSISAGAARRGEHVWKTDHEASNMT